MKKTYRFTMVELMVVIGIIFILAGMMLPALSSARRKARELNCINVQKQIGIFLMEYEHDFGGLPHGVGSADWSLVAEHPDKWLTTITYQDPGSARWTYVYYDLFLLGAGYVSDRTIFVCPLYGASQDSSGDRCNISPNAALFASNSTDRYPGAIYIGDGYGSARLRCRDWSFRWRHGGDATAKPHKKNLNEIGYDTTTGSANFLMGDGSVREMKAAYREQVCRDYIAYMGKGEPRGSLYLDEGSYDHINCKSSWVF